MGLARANRVILALATIACVISSSYAFAPIPKTAWEHHTNHGLPSRMITSKLPEVSRVSLEAKLGRSDAHRDLADADPMPMVALRNSRAKNFARAASAIGAMTLLIQPALASGAGTVPAASGLLSSLLSGRFDALVNSGFFQAFSLVFVSEIGDKTFFIAGLLAAKTSRLISFAGSIGALAVMTFLSCGLGMIFHAVPTAISNGIPFDDIIAAAAFAYFGVITLKDAFDMEDDDNSGMEEERAEAEKTVKDVGNEGKIAGIGSKTWSLVAQTFGLVFAAEFGDRSFITTIALSAAQDPLSVATGAISAHAIATGIAVTGGALLSEYISEKVVGYIGGTLFIVFALTTAFGLF